MNKAMRLFRGMFPKAEDLYSPERLIRVLDDGTLLVEGEPADETTKKNLKGEARVVLDTLVFPLLLETLRRDAVEIGVEKMTTLEQALYAKSIWHVTRMLERMMEEVAKAE